MTLKRKPQYDSSSGAPRKLRSTSRPYVYKPLSPCTFRVLALSPGESNDPLRGTLEVVSRRHQREYRAISYAWGDAVFPHRLYLPQGYLDITVSLFGALQRSRSTDYTVRLWADAVCINQQDAEEKNIQVEMMADIYKGSEGVVVWLGEALWTDSLAFWTVQRLSEFSRSHTEERDGTFNSEEVRKLPTQFEAWKARDYRFFELTIESAFHAASASIFRRTWFKRLWVSLPSYRSLGRHPGIGT